MHTEPHPLVDQKVTLPCHPDPRFHTGEPVEAEVIDWWDHLTGTTWGMSEGNPACMIYAMRTGLGPSLITGEDIGFNNEVVYVKINRIGHLIHQDELDAGAVKT